MKLSGALILVVLLAAAIVIFLQSRDTKASLDAVNSVAVDLREAGVSGTSLDRAAAGRALDALDQLQAAPDTIADHLDDLRTIAETAARWADAAPTPSQDLTAAVALRVAADELRQYGLEPAPAHLIGARREIARAREALVSGAAGPGGASDGSMPAGSSVQGVRDRLKNLQQGERERIQDVQQQINQ